MGKNEKAIIVIAVPFVLGVILGLLLSPGMKGDQKKVRDTGKRTGNAVIKSPDDDYRNKATLLEMENQNLRTRLQLLQEEKRGVADAMTDLRARLSQAQAELGAGKHGTAADRDTLKQRISELEKENQNLRAVAEGVRNILRGKIKADAVQ